MFDEAAEELADALAREQQALTFEAARDAISGSDLMSEQAIKQEAVVETVDDTKYVVAVDGRTDEFPLPGAGEETAEEEQEVDGEAAEGSSEPSEAADDPTPSAEFATAAADSQPVQTATRGLHTIGDGITIDVDPQAQLAGTPTGEEVYGCRKLHNSHPAIPKTEIPYYPANAGEQDERDTEDLFYRAVANHIPAILEGEAGSGKNQLVDSVCEALRLPKYRQEFGGDTSVFDVVGEKDIANGESYYILGTLAKAAIFGGMYIADEINMASGDVTSYLHPVFERRGKRELELRGTGVTLRDLPPGEEWDPAEHLGRYIHPDFHAVGTCNPPHYADTKPMNDALRSRCLVIVHPYLAESEADEEGIKREAFLLNEATGVHEEAVMPLVRTAAVLREARREANAITCPIGFRELRDTVEMAGPEEEFMSFEAAAKVKMVGQASLKQDRQYVVDTIEEEM